MHSIELNIDKQAVFFIPNRFHLSFEKPGPIEIDISDYSEQEKTWLRNAHHNNVLRIKNLSSASSDKKEVKQIQSENRALSPEQLKLQAEEKRKVLTEQLTKRLNAPMSSLKKSIAKTEDILELRLMKEIESTNKKRENVIELINNKINSIAQTLSSKIGSALDGSAFQSERGLPEVEESLEETVTVKLGE